MSLWSEWKSGIIDNDTYSSGCYEEEMRDVVIVGYTGDYDEDAVWCIDCKHYMDCDMADDTFRPCEEYEEDEDE